MFGVAVGATATGLLDDNKENDRSRLQKAKDNLTQATNNILTGVDKSQANLNAHMDAITDGDLTNVSQNQDILNELNTQLTHNTHADGTKVFLTPDTTNPQGEMVQGLANPSKGHTYLDIDHLDNAIETLNHEIAHHNGQGETSATAMGKLGNIAYNIGTSLNQEDINTHRQGITPTRDHLATLSSDEQLAYHTHNQAILDENKEQLEGEMGSGDGLYNAPYAVKQAQLITKRHKKECNQLGIPTNQCGKYHGDKSLKTLKEVGLFIVPTTPEEIAIAVVTGGAGGYVIKAGGKVISKAFKNRNEAEKVLSEAREATRIENNVYRDDSYGYTWSQGRPRDFGQNLTEHWNKHKHEFPEFRSQNDYHRFAIEFMKNPPSGTLRKNRPNGDVLMYNPKDNTFMSIDKYGSIRTMFRPNDGIEYWNRQR